MSASRSELAESAESNESGRRARIFEMIAEVLEIDPKTVHATDRLREDLGMDSLGSLELLSLISHELAIDLEMEEAMGIGTVADACAFVEKNYAQQRQAAGANNG